MSAGVANSRTRIAPPADLHVAGELAQEAAGLDIHGLEADDAVEREGMLVRREHAAAGW